MLATLLLGIAAGAGAPYAEPHVKSALDGMLQSETPIDAMELRLFTFAILLVGAALLSMIFGSAHAMPLAIGAAIGVFGPRILEKYRASKRPDYDS